MVQIVIIVNYYYIRYYTGTPVQTALTNHLSYLSEIIEVKTTNGCFYFEY